MKLNRLDSAINRENREKLNENMSIIENDFSNMNIDVKDFKETVEENSRLVNQANLNASKAVILSNAVQDELDSIVVEGDSSVEAAQARTNSDTGETYISLRSRLDDENKVLTQKLAQVENEFVSEIERLELEKVEKVQGKQLTTNDYTDDEKTLVSQVPIKADKMYVDGIISGITTVKPRDVFLSISALHAAFPNGDDGFYIAYDSSFPDGAHGFIWSETDKEWKDTGLWKGDGLEDGGVTPSKLSSDFFKSKSGLSLNFRYGTVNGNSGIVTHDSPNRIRTNFMQVDNGDEIYIIAEQGVKAWLAVYELNGTFVNSTVLTKRTFTQSYKVIIVAAYSDDRDISRNEFDLLADKLIIKQSKMKDLEMHSNKSSYASASLFYWKLGTIANGVEAPSTNRCVSDYISINAGSVVKILNNIKLAVHYYDKDYIYDESKTLLFTQNSAFWESEESGYVRIVLAHSNDATINDIDVLINVCEIQMYDDLLLSYKESQKAKKDVLSQLNKSNTHDTSIYNFSYGRVNNNSGGIIYDGKNRVTSELVPVTKDTTIELTDASLYQLAINAYDTAATFLGVANTLSLTAFPKWTAKQDGYVRITLAYKDDANIAINDNTLKKACVITTKTLANDVYKEVFTKNKDRYLAQLPYGVQGMTFVGNQLWTFTASSNDGVGQNGFRIYEVNDETGSVRLVNSNLHKLGHCNTVNYNDALDALILSNGDINDTYEYGNKFWVLEDVKSFAVSPIPITRSMGVEYDVSALNWSGNGESGRGAVIQPCWGEDNNGKYNIVYALYNNFHKKYIAKLLLGQGSNVLDYGTFIAGKTGLQFNGTFKVLETYEGVDYTDHECTQDATWHNGYIYEGLGHDGLWHSKIKLNHKTEKTEEVEFLEQLYDDDGNKITSVTNGMTIRNNRLYMTWYFNSTYHLTAREL